MHIIEILAFRMLLYVIDLACHLPNQYVGTDMLNLPLKDINLPRMPEDDGYDKELFWHGL